MADKGKSFKLYGAGFMVSEARATAWAVVAGVAKEILEEDYYTMKDADLEYIAVPCPLIAKLSKAYSALMGIVEEEESGFKRKIEEDKASGMLAGEDVHRLQREESGTTECVPDEK